MVNDNKKHDAAELYRQYQSSRDNIPSSVLSHILSEADQALNESSIHGLIEAAKVASYSSDNGTSSAKKESWFSSVANQIKMAIRINTKPLGAAFACLAIIAVLVPILGEYKAGNNFSETAHLSDCAKCSSYLANALAITRGPSFGSGNSDARIASKIGLIQALLKIETNQESVNANSFVYAQINRLPKSIIDDELSSLFARDAHIPEIIAALQERSPDVKISQASEALFIANITSRFAIDNPQSNDISIKLHQSWSSALELMQSINQTTDQQSLAIEKIASIINSESLASRKAIKAVEFASKSLEH